MQTLIKILKQTADMGILLDCSMFDDRFLLSVSISHTFCAIHDSILLFFAFYGYHICINSYTIITNSSKSCAELKFVLIEYVRINIKWL